TLTLGSTRTRSALIDNNDTDDIYRFNVTSPTTLSVSITGLTDNIGVYLAYDQNGNGVYDGGNEFIAGSFEPGTADDAFSANLTPGTYFAWVYRDTGNSPYRLTLHAYNDSTAPTARLDATDLKTSGAPYVDLSITYSDDNDLDGLATRYYSGIDIHTV